MQPKSNFFAALLVAAPLSNVPAAHAEEPEFGYGKDRPWELPVLATSGSSGALNVPDGRILQDGMVVLGINNAIEPQFERFSRGENYQFGVGLLPYVELSGRLANYPKPQGGLGVRDLSASIKVAVPKIFKYQPEIALGYNDLGGGVPYFRSKYLAVSDSFGPLRLNVGVARGEPYLGKVFGSAELALWDTGLSAVLERNHSAYSAGVRFVSRPISYLANGQVVVNAQRSFNAQAPSGASADKSSAGVFLALPFGRNASNPRKVALRDEPIWTPPVATGTDARAVAVGGRNLEPLWTPPGGVEKSVSQSSIPALVAPGSDLYTALPLDKLQALGQIQAQVIKAGLERVRVGIRGSELVIEYENHRYNQNEVDAIGIVLGLGVTLAPEGVGSVTAVTKKAGLALYQASVDQRVYRRFLRDGDSYDAKSALEMRYRPGSGRDVQWLEQQEGPRGYSRVRIDPQLVKFVGTELGVFDYSLSANIQAFVPLWTGAEASMSYVRTLAESDDVKHGFLGYAQQPNKLKAALLSQSLWLTGSILNVTSAGRFIYNARGVQNETTWFMPWRDDQLRLQATSMRQVDFYGVRSDTKTGSASYLWTYLPLGATVEVAYNRYQSKDKGPSLQISRWLGDVQAQAYLRTSELDKKVGFSLAFPLTPRQGMRPGWTHLEGSSSFPFKLETRLTSKGGCNCIINGVVEELPMVYSARGNLLNHARTGKDYLISQLQRMREAALVYASVVP